MKAIRFSEHSRSGKFDVTALAEDLAAAVKGEVRFDNGSRALYATDGSNYRQAPIGVVVPRSVVDILQTIAICREYHTPILPRGGGTSLAGQCCNIAVIMDMSKFLHHILELNPEKKYARVQPGLVLDDLRTAAENHHLTFAPDPSTHNHCTLGGMIGNNSCGVHSVMGGKTDDNVEELDLVTYDGIRMRVGKTSDLQLQRLANAEGRIGRIYSGLKSLRDKYSDLIRARFPKIPRRVSGYNLDKLLPENGFDVAKALVGSEGTCVTILEAKLRLVHSPPSRSLLVLGYPDVYTAGDHVTEILESNPIGLEGLDDVLVSDMKKKGLHPEDVQLLPEGNGWLLVEFGGDNKDESDGKAGELMDRLRSSGNAPSMKLFDNPAEEKMVWKVRESGLGATARVPGAKDTWEGWEDSAVPPDKVGPYLRKLRSLFQRYGYQCALYGHFGQGCIHTRIDFDLATDKGIKSFRSFLGEASDLVLSFGGSLSGEHGDGQSRAELLPKMFGPELVQAFREFKSIWDPELKMNPGKLVDPYLITENLRLGTGYRHPRINTHFSFSEDDGNFTRATLRCVGVGECRKEHTETMCPSYRVTREEMHSTRGRAHLLFEMIQGNPLKGGWRDPQVREALDLCLSCKGCKGECPVNVDIATYKAEFLSHYYEGRLRPLNAYVFGLINRWAEAASLIPFTANLFTQTPSLSALLKLIARMPQQRQIPPFASYTFKDWFRRHQPRNEGKKVILWPDTFNNHFHPETAEAAVEVLEAAGYQVEVPLQPVCCGRPLYDYGMLETAKKYLSNVIRVLEPQLFGDVPIVFLEPSCLSVFRDEATDLFPRSEGAKRLKKNSLLFSELLDKTDHGYSLPKLHSRAVVHGHCHHKSIIKMNSEESVLTKMELRYSLLDSGCCGMAGGFGFEKDHYDISIKVGNRVLLPAVRKADKDTLIIADGFSCREQIAQTTDRRALHLAQVIQMAMRNGSRGAGIPYPERHFEWAQKRKISARESLILGTAGVLLAGSLVTLTRGRKKWMSGRRKWL